MVTCFRKAWRCHPGSALKRMAAMASKVRNLLPASMLAILAAGSYLAVPTPARAQPVTAEQALLNRNDNSPAAYSSESAAAVFAHEEISWIDGEAALLNRRATPVELPADPPMAQPAISHAGSVAGEEAL